MHYSMWFTRGNRFNLLHTLQIQVSPCCIDTFSKLKLARKTQKTNFTKLKLARFTKDPSPRGAIDVTREVGSCQRRLTERGAACKSCRGP